MAKQPARKNAAPKATTKPRRAPRRRAATAATPAARSRRFGVAALSVGAAAIGLGGALLAAFLRKRPAPAEHAAPDLAADAPTPGTNRAPEAFRPDPTAVPTAAEREALRPATGPLPSMIQGKAGLNGATAHVPDA